MSQEKKSDIELRQRILFTFFGFLFIPILRGKYFVAKYLKLFRCLVDE